MRNKLIHLLVLCMVVVFSGCTSSTPKQAAESSVKQAAETTKTDDQIAKGTQNQQNTASQSNDLTASLPLLPKLVDSSEKGYYVDLVKSIDELYTEGNIKILANPIARAQELVIAGQADFYLPKVITKYTDISKLPYHIITKPIGHSAFVLYSNVNKKLTKEDLDKALDKGGTFPYKLESTPGLKESFKYPYSVSNSVEESIKKVAAGRIDGFIWAQEDVDSYLNSAKVKSIHRSHFFDFDDVICLAKNDKTEKLDKAFTECIAKLESSGKLGQIYSNIHVPFKDWQPADMGW